MAIRCVFTLMMIVAILATPAEALFVPYDQDNMSFPITLNNAQNAIHTWVNDPTLLLKLCGVEGPSDDLSACNYLYVFKTIDDLQVFSVDCYTGEVRHWQDVALYRAYLDKLNARRDTSEQLSLANLQSIVLQFLSCKYANFSGLNMQSTNSAEISPAFAQKLSNGVWYTGNNARCIVDPWDGVVTEYYGEHQNPPTISVEPEVTSQQAEQIALNYAGTVLVTSYNETTEESELVPPQSAFILENAGLWIASDVLGAQRLQWEIDIIVCAQPGYTATEYLQELQEELSVTEGQQISICVDAHTGIVLYSAQTGYMGSVPSKLDRATAGKVKTYKPDTTALKNQPDFGKAKLVVDEVVWSELSYPVYVVNDTAYLCAKYLPLLYGGTIAYISGETVLHVAGKTAKIRAGSKYIDLSGEKIKTSHPPIIISGRTYIPSEVLNLVGGCNSKWDSAKKLLYISSRRGPLKPLYKRLPFKRFIDCMKEKNSPSKQNN